MKITYYVALYKNTMTDRLEGSCGSYRNEEQAREVFGEHFKGLVSPREIDFEDELEEYKEGIEDVNCPMDYNGNFYKKNSAVECFCFDKEEQEKPNHKMICFQEHHDEYFDSHKRHDKAYVAGMEYYRYLKAYDFSEKNLAADSVPHELLLHKITKLAKECS